MVLSPIEIKNIHSRFFCNHPTLHFKNNFKRLIGVGLSNFGAINSVWLRFYPVCIRVPLDIILVQGVNQGKIGSTFLVPLFL